MHLYIFELVKIILNSFLFTNSWIFVCISVTTCFLLFIKDKIIPLSNKSFGILASLNFPIDY